MDKQVVDRAIAFAASRLRTNVQIYRNNCLVGSGPFNGVSGDLPWQLWSSTKSIVSMLAGVAYTQGKLALDAPIGTYLPAARGDAAHRAITVRQLLTQTSGLQQSVVAEGLTGVLDIDPNIVEQALALPLQHAPGTYFEYTQHGPDLLAYVVERAVGQDLQVFAQQHLFDLIGIGTHDYYWARDRSGNSYGYAFMFMPPNDYSRLGLLMLDGGRWNGRRIIAADYIDRLRSPSSTNPCYGYLFWTNHTPCIGPSIPSRQTTGAALLSGLPPDAYAMVGFLNQNNFIVPSLGLLVSWNGFLVDVSPDPSTLIRASQNSELYHDFVRTLAPAFDDVRLPDIGPYRPSINLDVDPTQFINPNVLLGGLGFGPYAPKECSESSCGTTPLRAPFAAAPPGCLLFVCVPVSPATPRHR